MSNGYRQLLPEYIAREAKPIEKFSHQPRLYAIAQRIGKGIDHDDEVLFAASWLHDLGVFIGHRPEAIEELVRWDHVRYAMDKAPAVLAGANFPVDKIPAVLEAIRTHQPHDEPATMEGIILRDADILEQLGAIGILRTVCKVGRDSRFQRFGDAVNSLRRALIQLPAAIELDVTRTMAQPKITALQDFLAAVEAESFETLL